MTKLLHHVSTSNLVVIFLTVCGILSCPLHVTATSIGVSFSVAKIRLNKDCLTLSLRKLCFYTCLSVILFTGGYLLPVHAGMHTPPPRPEAGTTLPPRPKAGILLGTRGRHPPWGQCMLGDTGNKRAVRILLECILVANTFTADLEDSLSNQVKMYTLCLRVRIFE